MSEKNLFIGIPVYGPVDSHFFKCAMHMAAYYATSNCKVYIHTGDSLICRARNHITRLFLESECTHLLMIDSDLIFGNYHIERILKHTEDVVGGVYTKKQEGDPQIVCNSLGGVAERSEHDEHLLQVKYVGTGFIRIARSVFEKMIEAFGEEMWYSLDSDGKTKEYDFWRAAPYEYSDKTRRYLSEDWWFCQKWMDLGGKIWLDLACVMKHSGNAIYPLEYQEKKLLARHHSEAPQLFESRGDTADTIVQRPITGRAVEDAVPLL